MKNIRKTLYAVCFSCVTVVPGYAVSYDKEINEYQEQISSKKQSLDAVQQKLSEIQELHKQYSAEEKKIKSDLSHTDEQLKNIREKIKNLTHTYESAKLKQIRLKKDIEASSVLKNYWQDHLSDALVSYYIDFLAFNDYSADDIFRFSYRASQVLDNAGRIIVAEKNLQKSSSSIERLERKKNVLKKDIGEKLTKKRDLAKNKNFQNGKYKSIQNKYMQSGQELGQLQKSAALLQALIREIQKHKKETEDAQKEMAHAKKIASSKGLLPWPIVGGSVVSRFGKIKHPKLNTYIYNNGIEIVSATHYDVHAVAKGNVVFSGTFGGFGNMVIIDHRGSFFTVYGHLDTIAVKKGSSVKGYDIIGKVKEKKGMLYFEIRKKDSPEDPIAWLKKK